MQNAATMVVAEHRSHDSEFVHEYIDEGFIVEEHLTDTNLQQSGEKGVYCFSQVGNETRAVQVGEGAFNVHHLLSKL